MNTLSQTCGGLQPLSATSALLIALHDDLGLQVDRSFVGHSNNSQRLTKAGTLSRNTLHMTTAALQQRAIASNSGWSSAFSPAEANSGQYEFTAKRRAPVCPKPSMRWSREAHALKQALAELQPLQPSPLRTVPGLLSYFTHLDLSSLGVGSLDETLVRECKSLRELSLSNNRLAVITDVPAALQSLNAYYNRIESLIFPQVRPSLLHLGLGFNRLSSLGPRDNTRLVQELSTVEGLMPASLSVPGALPNLVSLDLTGNDVDDLRQILQQLIQLKRLKHLVLTGNPICLVKDYMLHVLSALPELDSLDEVTFNAATKADLQQKVTQAGRPLGLQEGARTDIIELNLTLDSVSGLPSPTSLLEYLRLSPAAVPSLGLGGPPRPTTADTKGAKAGPGKGSAPIAPAAIPLLVVPPCRYVLEVDLAGLWHGQSKNVQGMYSAPAQDQGVSEQAAGKTGARPASAAKAAQPAPAASKSAAASSSKVAAATSGPTDHSASQPTSTAVTKAGRKYSPAASAIVFDETAIPVQLLPTAETRDALLQQALRVRLIEVQQPVDQGSLPETAEERRVIAVAELPLKALLTATDRSIMTIGHLSGDDMPCMSVHDLPAPARVALAEIKSAMHAAKAALDLQAADAAARPTTPASQPAGKPAPAAAKKAASAAVPEPTPAVEPSMMALLASEGGSSWDDERLGAVIQGICSQSRAKLGLSLSLLRLG